MADPNEPDISAGEIETPYTDEPNTPAGETDISPQGDQIGDEIEGNELQENKNGDSLQLGNMDEGGQPDEQFGDDSDQESSGGGS